MCTCMLRPLMQAPSPTAGLPGRERAPPPAATPAPNADAAPSADARQGPPAPHHGGEKASRLQRYITLGSINVESYGKASFAALVGHFAGRTLPYKIFTATPDEIRQEFLAMKRLMSEVARTLKITDPCKVWESLINRHNAIAVFPNVNKLVHVMFLIPVQTAIVEQGFSLHRILKNRLSNRLKVMTLDSLLRIKLGTAAQSVSELKGSGFIDSAADVHSYSPVSKRRDFFLADLFKRVQDLDLGYLDDGVNDDEPNWDVVGVDGNDERGSESEDDEEQRELWISDEEKEVPDGADAFGQADEESEGMQVDDDLDNVM